MFGRDRRALCGIPVQAPEQRRDRSGTCLKGGCMRYTGEVEAPPTIGVEEEFLLVDPRTGAPIGRNVEVVRTAADFGLDLQLEIMRCQVETSTRIHTGTRDLLRELRELRRGASAAAEKNDAVLLAVAVPPTVSRSARGSGRARRTRPRGPGRSELRHRHRHRAARARQRRPSSARRVPGARRALRCDLRTDRGDPDRLPLSHVPAEPTSPAGATRPTAGPPRRWWWSRRGRCAPAFPGAGSTAARRSSRR